MQKDVHLNPYCFFINLLHPKKTTIMLPEHVLRLIPSNTLDIPTFFHTILFAYQKKLKDILGPGGAIFVHPGTGYYKLD